MTTLSLWDSAQDVVTLPIDSVRERTYVPIMLSQGKGFPADSCDYLYAHTACGRRWFIPAEAVDGGQRDTAGRAQVRGT